MVDADGIGVGSAELRPVRINGGGETKEGKNECAHALEYAQNCKTFLSLARIRVLRKEL